MEEGLKKVFQNSIYFPEGRLSEDIWITIKKKNDQIIKVKKIGYMSLSILSLSGCVLSVKNLIEHSVRLGFWDYVSLVFSDGLKIIKYWKEFSLSLIHSLPATSLILTLILIFLLLSSVRGLSYQFKNKFVYE